MGPLLDVSCSIGTPTTSRHTRTSSRGSASCVACLWAYRRTRRPLHTFPVQQVDDEHQGDAEDDDANPNFEWVSRATDLGDVVDHVPIPVEGQG